MKKHGSYFTRKIKPNTQYSVYMLSLQIEGLWLTRVIDITSESDSGFVSPKYRNIGHRKFHVNRRTLFQRLSKGVEGQSRLPKSG